MSNLTARANRSAAITAQVSSESEKLLLDEATVDLSVDIGTSPLIDDRDSKAQSMNTALTGTVPPFA
jgi:hypothetical protein